MDKCFLPAMAKDNTNISSSTVHRHTPTNQQPEAPRRRNNGPPTPLQELFVWPLMWNRQERRKSLGS